MIWTIRGIIDNMVNSSCGDGFWWMHPHSLYMCWGWGSKTNCNFCNKQHMIAAKTSLCCIFMMARAWFCSAEVEPSVVLPLLLVMRGSWTLSCQRWLTKITLTLLAYHGPSGAGSSSLVCLRVPWYTWGLIGCVKFSLCVWVYLSCWYCECCRVWWGCLFISVCDTVFVCMRNHLGREEVILKKSLDGLLLRFAKSWSVWFSLHHDSGRCPSKLAWERSHEH